MARGSKTLLSPLHLLHRAGQRADYLFAHHVGSHVFTPRQFAVLQAVANADGLSQTAIMQATGIDRSGTAELVRRLVSGGLLQRRRTNGGRARVRRAACPPGPKKCWRSASARVTRARAFSCFPRSQVDNVLRSSPPSLRSSKTHDGECDAGDRVGLDAAVTAPPLRPEAQRETFYVRRIARRVGGTRVRPRRLDSALCSIYSISSS